MLPGAFLFDQWPPLGALCVTRYALLRKKMQSGVDCILPSANLCRWKTAKGELGNREISALVSMASAASRRPWKRHGAQKSWLFGQGNRARRCAAREELCAPDRQMPTGIPRPGDIDYGDRLLQSLVWFSLVLLAVAHSLDGREGFDLMAATNAARLLCLRHCSVF